jgi:hypothetical protein
VVRAREPGADHAAARSGKLVVGCPPGFYRRGNVEIVCERFAIPLVASWDDFVAAVRAACHDG